MTKTLASLISRLSDRHLMEAAVIRWSAPVPSFGNPARALLATVGLNPSNREFVDEDGQELDGAARRFHTLRSLGIEQWSEVEARHMRMIGASCNEYFRRNPYDGWFKRLDYMINGLASYYETSQHTACHLDLVPYATACKWTDLDRSQRGSLMKSGSDALGLVVRDSSIQLLVLNGNAAVRGFESLAGIALSRTAMAGWSLPRRGGTDVAGFAYSGVVSRIAGVDLRRDVTVLGYNHNIQSSFGVTKSVMSSIRTWISNYRRRALA